MVDSFAKLDQALKDLIEAYSELETELSGKFENDDEAFSTAVIEVLETSIEGALEEQDVETKAFANLLTLFSDALEQIDPVAFEDAVEEDEDAEGEYEDDDDLDYDDLDDDEDEDEE